MVEVQEGEYFCKGTQPYNRITAMYGYKAGHWYRRDARNQPWRRYTDEVASNLCLGGWADYRPFPPHSQARFLQKVF